MFGTFVGVMVKVKELIDISNQSTNQPTNQPGFLWYFEPTSYHYFDSLKENSFSHVISKTLIFLVDAAFFLQ